MEKLINLEEKNLYDFIMNLKKSDIEELLKSSKTEEEKNFYYKLQELILRIQQEKLIAEGVF
nr:GNAT family acetyltransferase [uncultured Fusobacterium sp.]